MPSPATHSEPDQNSITTGETTDRAADPLDLFTALARTGLFLDELQRDCLAPHSLSFTEYSVLRLLQRAPRKQLSPTTLAENIVCTTGAMTKLADRLERAGYIERDRDPKDRRGVLICMTREGGKIANSASRSYKTARQRILSQIDPQKAQRLQIDLLQLQNLLANDRSER